MTSVKLKCSSMVVEVHNEGHELVSVKEMCMSTPGLGGGGGSTGIVSGTAGVGGGVAAAVTLPQTGILPVTGTVSLLLLVSVGLAVAIVASMVAAKLSKRAI
jgi:hypothetical protein